MPLFRYEALTHGGGSVKNTLEADSKTELVSRLRQMGYWPTTIVEETEEETSTDVRSWLKIGQRGVKPADVEFFTYQLATLVNAHVPLPRALEVTLGQIQNPALHRIVSQVKYDVEHGATFNDALSQHPKAFSELYINMVKAGESGGVLGLVLERLAEFAERQRLLKNDVISALFYPIILLTLSVSAVTILMIVVIPKFTAMFNDLGVALPLPTRILIGTTDFFQSYWWVALIIVIAGVAGLRQYLQLEAGQVWFDRLKLKLPLIGPIFSTFAVIRFTRTMATLLENGVRMLPALQVVKDTIGNKVYSNVVAEAEIEVEQGSTLSRELGKTKDFPEFVTHMVAVGEESGEPVHMLSRLSDYYDLEIKKSLERLTSSIGPLVILLMGVIIGFIAVAMILPIFEANQLLSG